MPDGTSKLGKIATQIAAEGGTADPFVGTFTFQYTRDSCHLLRQPLFRVLSPADPSVQLKFATDYTWQAQLGWTLIHRKFDAFGYHLEFSLQQSIGRQFGAESKESAFIASLLAGEVKYPIAKSNLAVAIEGAFAGRHQDDKVWKVTFDGSFKFVWEFDAVFK